MTKQCILFVFLTLVVSLSLAEEPIRAPIPPQHPIRSSVSVAISPSAASLQTGKGRQFTATVKGASNTSVNWTASGGTISSDGMYTAPATPGSYVVTATSMANGSESASAAVTVSATPAVSITISPTSSSILTGGTQQFTASVTGSSNTAVTWSATGGSISSGLYTAPSTAGTYTVTATSQAASTASASATVTVSAPVAATPTFSPGAGSYSSAQTVTIASGTSAATICYTTNGTTPVATTPGTCSTGTALTNGSSVTVSVSETLEAIATESGFTNSGVGSASYTISSCAQELAVGNFTLCGESYNDVSSGTNVQVNYSPSPNNGIIAWATWCFNSSCDSSISGVTATIGDNINATESCFVASPHSPFITNANGGSQGSGDFQQHYVWYCPSIPSGVTSFTVTPSNPDLSYLQLNISEWKAGSLAASCSPTSACFENVDNSGQAGNSTGGTTATITTSGSTVNANDLIFAVTEVPCCSFTASPGTGYTGITVAPSVTPGMVSEAEAATATGIQTATTTWTGGNTPWFGVIVPLKGAGAAPVVSTPTFSPGAGTYSSAQSVTITSTTSGATICYTTNGITPVGTTPGTCSTGTALANGGSVTVSTSETLEAIATESGFTNSSVISGTYTIGAVAPITLVQHTSEDAGTTTSSSLAFSSNTTAGNWIAVCIRAGKTNQVFTVSDSQGNTYKQAVQLTVTVDTPNGDSLAIYYAENIKGGADTITVSDTISGTLRFAILEYSGVATANSLDVTASAQGTNASPSSGAVTTTANGELLLGAIMSADSESFTAGSGYTAEELVPAEPKSKLLVEDQILMTAGSILAGASLGASDPWGVVLATFKADPTALSITGSLPSGSVGAAYSGTVVAIGGTPGYTWPIASGSLAPGLRCSPLPEDTVGMVRSVPRI